MGAISAELAVYLWTITSGGKGRGRPTERRIQITGVDHIPLRSGVRALLGGWSEEAGVYAFWDVRRHQGFTAGSPSLQMALATLENGYHHGFATETRHVREGEEIAIAVQPDYLSWYLEEWERLYECGEDINRAPDLIESNVEEEREFVDSGESDQQRSRRHKVVTVVHNFRDARFRPTVLRAYNFRCCITGMALRLVDAAHIIPASDPHSADEPWNGLALSAHFHRAYDNGLVGVLPGGRLATNTRIEAKLRRDRLDAGLPDLKETMPPNIRFPASPDARPRESVLRRGLLLRGWTEDDIALAMRA